MEVLWKNYLGNNMTCTGFLEDPLPERERIFPAMREYLPIGFVLTPKEYRNRIVLDLGILMIPTLDFCPRC